MKPGQFGRAFIKLNRGILKLPAPWRTWNMLLAVVNGVVPLLFLRHLEAQFVWAAFLASMTLMTVLCGVSGFTRLLGLGHVFWIPLLWFLWARLDQIPSADSFGVWIRLLMALNAVSLVIDTSDVIRYVLISAYERLPALSTKENRHRIPARLLEYPYSLDGPRVGFGSEAFGVGAASRPVGTSETSCDLENPCACAASLP